MSWITVVLIFVIVVIIPAYLINLPNRRQAKLRSEDLQAAGLELSFIYQGNRDLFKEETDFPNQQLALLANPGNYRTVMRGLSRLGKTYLFEFEYTRGSGDTATTHNQMVAAFSLPGITLPAFSITPRYIFQKLIPLYNLQRIEKAFYYNDSIFESHPKFSRAYRVQGLDEDGVRALFQPEMLEYWESLPSKERWLADGSGHWLIVFRDNSTVRAEELRTFLHKAEEIATMFQQHASARDTIS